MSDPFIKQISLIELSEIFNLPDGRKRLEEYLILKYESDEEGKLNVIPVTDTLDLAISHIIKILGQDKFYEILKSKIGDGKLLFDSKKHVYMEGQFSERDAIWNTGEGSKINISNMSSRHLFNSLKLICKKDQKVCAERKHMIRVMFYQIQLREDLTDEQMSDILNLAFWVKNNL